MGGILREQRAKSERDLPHASMTNDVADNLKRLGRDIELARFTRTAGPWDNFTARYMQRESGLDRNRFRCWNAGGFRNPASILLGGARPVYLIGNVSYVETVAIS